MITKRLVLIFALMALLSTMSLAQKFEFTPFGGYRTIGQFEIAPNVLEYANLKIGDGFAWGFSLGYRVNDALTIEAMWSRTTSGLTAELAGGETQGIFDLNLDHLHANFLLYVGRGARKVQPYVLLGLGATYFNPKSSEANGEWRFSWSLGGGLIAMFTRSVGARLQAKWVPTYINTSSALWIDWWGYPWVVPVNNFMSQGEFTGGIVFRF